MKKVYILAALTLMGQSSWAQIRDFQTTRLNSTAGAGVASILSTEAAILNPAAAAFFDGSSFSYQSYATALHKESDLRKAANDDFSSQNKSQGAFMADHSGPVKGGVAYIDQSENGFDRTRMVLHGSAPMGPKSSMGIAYNYIQDKRPDSYSPGHNVLHQITFGTTFIIDEGTTLGLVINDPTNSNTGDDRVIAGFQYLVTNRFTLIGDVGARYTKAVEDYYLWRAALQINIFSDFFFRAGTFYDNILKFKGNGWGVGWVGPRFGVEFAQKISEQFATSYIYKDEQLVDTSLSVIIKF